MASEYAREVKVFLHDNGVIKDIDDPEAPGVFGGKWDIDQELPLDGEQYEWTLEPYKQTGVDILHLYRSEHQVAANAEGLPSHRNTVGLKIPELIKLDCGHWGGYKRWREFPGSDNDGKALGRQREFGLIEGAVVWLCCFVRGDNDKVKKVHESTIRETKRRKTTLAEALATKVYQSGGGAIKFLKVARTRSFTRGLSSHELIIAFPDLHLPERWPDLPRDQDRHPDVEARKRLQTWLRESQRKPGVVFGSTWVVSDQEEIQRYFEKIAGMSAGDRAQARLDWVAGNKDSSLLFRLGWTKRWGDYFTPDHFEAEKAVVDREFRLRSTWFYARGPKWSEEVAPGSTDWFDAIIDNGNGDASPAVDLVNFLASIKALRDDQAFIDSGNRLRVIQVGDIYEAWVNREFLYRNFWVRDTEAGSAGTAVGIRQGGDRSKGDNFQYRMDARWRGLNDNDAITTGLHVATEQRTQWYEPDMPAAGDKHPVKRYVFHELPSAEMLYRHVVGDMIREDYDLGQLEKQFGLPAGELVRRQELLKQRIDNIEAFSLPFPQAYEESANATARQLGRSTAVEITLMDPSEEAAAKVMVGMGTGAIANQTFTATNAATTRYLRINARGDAEVKWNLLMLDLLYDVVGDPKKGMLYGNHDGYRGDWVLNQKIGRAACPGWLSLPGAWFEHSHRWDPFNRDGCAFGAGAANFTYFWFNNMCSKFAGKIETVAAKQEQAVFQPGAALWFLLVNFGQNQPWFKKLPHISKVKPFGLYVSGHTHSGDLIRMTFHTTFWSNAGSGSTTDAVKSTLPGAASKEQYASQRDAGSQRDAFVRQSQDSSGRVGPEFKWLKPR